MFSYVVLVCLLTLGFALPFPSKGSANSLGNTTFLTARAGDDIRFNCTTADAAANVSLWHADRSGNEKKVSPSRNSVTQRGSIFTLLHISVKDFGMYKCKVLNGCCETTVKEFHLFHLPPTNKVSVKVDPQTQSVITGRHAIFTCVATMIKPVWNKVEASKNHQVRRMPITDGHIVSSSKDGRIFKSILYFKNTTTSDDGLYECVTIDQHGYQQRMYARLVVKDLQAPKVVAAPSFVLVKEGESKTLQCKVTGFPKPQVIWMKDGRPRKVCDRRNNVNCDGNSRYFARGTYGLKIKNIRYPEDHGKFVCLATNIAGFASDEVNVDVAVAPKMGTNEKTYIRRSGSAVDIKCNVQYSNPPPTFTWMYRLDHKGLWHSAAKIVHQFGNIKQEGKLTSVLQISKSVRVPSNLYLKCQASNPEGTDATDFLLLEASMR